MITKEEADYLKEFVNHRGGGEPTQLIELWQRERGATLSKICPLCLVEKALILYNEYLKGIQPPTRYILKEGVNVTFGSEVINSATITDEKAERWIKSGFPLSFFAQIATDEELNTDTKEKPKKKATKKRKKDGKKSV